ncbi:Lactate utilization protein [Micromonospora noduli]|uniref:LutC/YkgG family protein n=1 Tax=Micromonospora noduli TaxID=709876 RepID=UPI000DBF7E23|nr:LUD domain-containing protein [Micromonospora noduli]RAO32646.1 Lactate utilization protein [Micromonospora noduli]
MTTGSARDDVLARIRNALSASPTATIEPARGYRREGHYSPGAPQLLSQLTERLTDYRAAVHAATPDTLASVLEAALAGTRRVLVPPGLPGDWMPATAVIDDGSLTPTELDTVDAVLTACTAAAADTGTIVLDASPDQGRRASTLIPDRHVCVLRAAQVVQTVPELLSRVDPRRPLTFISGPSATSDIELQRVEGVHGPRTLIVVILSDSKASR